MTSHKRLGARQETNRPCSSTDYDDDGDDDDDDDASAANDDD